MEKEKLGEYTFKVLPFEVDFRGKLTLPSLTNYILNTAGYHAEDCGFGIQKLNRDNLSWVLSRLVIEMKRYPVHYEKIIIQTWVEGVMRMFTLRNFAFLSREGGVLGYARTIWAMIDQNTRKPLDLTQTDISSYINHTKECPIAKAGKIPVLDNEPKEIFTIKYSDIDINQHFNSSKYVEHIINAFTLHKFRKRDIARFEIDFMAESTFGEAIYLHKQENADNEFIIELKNTDKQTISKSKIYFGNETG
jgi:acyl-ACP thioesterase